MHWLAEAAPVGPSPIVANSNSKQDPLSIEELRLRHTDLQRAKAVIHRHGGKVLWFQLSDLIDMGITSLTI